MKSVKIKVNGQIIKAFEDGSVEKSIRNRSKRTSGSDSHGYRQTWINDKVFRIHRIIAQAFLDDYSEDLQCDHINGIKSDNRPENLRMVTNKQNSHGFKSSKSGSSPYRGVTWDGSRKKWRARIRANGKLNNIGRFECEHEAALAWNELARKLGFTEEAMNSVIINSL